MAAVDSLERTAARSERQTAYYRALLAALSPDPQDWEYRGECLDLGQNGGGHCACGHDIRWAFVLERNSHRGETVQVGSTCICHFSSINPITYEQLADADADLQQRLREGKAQAKKAAQAQQVQHASTKFLDVFTQANTIMESYKSTGKKSPRALWEATVHSQLRVPMNPPQYKRVSALLNWYTKKTEQLQQALVDCELQPDPAIQHEQMLNEPDVTQARDHFHALWSQANTEYERYRSSRKRAPKALWKVCASDYYYIPSDAPKYLTEKPALLAWYTEQSEFLQDALDA